MLLKVACLTLLLSQALAAPFGDTALATKKRQSFPFNRIVAFGDDHSDNGNGSFAHGFANPNNPKDKIYGFKTWTNGAIAVSYLADLLGVPLTNDYAYGGRNGGSKLGATIDTTYTPTTVPDGFAQVATYLSDPNATANIAKTLHFLWLGNNDVNIAHIWVGSKAHNNQFSQNMTAKYTALVQQLVDAGAQHVLVPSMYAKQFAPISPTYFGIKTPEAVAGFGEAIDAANKLVAKTLTTTFGNKVVTYDLFSYMSNIWNNRQAYGFTRDQTMCDGSGNQAWQDCMINGKGGQFFWMQYVMMTTKVYSMIAQDMATAVRAAFQ